jgi:hypothetical protein
MLEAIDADKNLYANLEQKALKLTNGIVTAARFVFNICGNLLTQLVGIV